MCIDVDILVILGADGKVVVVALVEDEAYIANEHTILLVVHKLDFAKINLDFDLFATRDIRLLVAYELCREELNVSRVNHRTLEGVMRALLMHDVYVGGLDNHAHCLPHLKGIIVLNHNLVVTEQRLTRQDISQKTW